MTETQCSANRQPDRCCVGHPSWDAATVMTYGEPLPQEVIDTATETGIEPHRLASHVEGDHGWESQDAGYAEAVRKAADCLFSGGCS